MTVYVDDAYIEATVRNGDRTYTSRWCHLTADTREELHQFATEVMHMRRAWFQDHVRLWHYDLTEGKRHLAVKFGAKEISQREMVQIGLRRKVPHAETEGNGDAETA